MTRPRRLCLAAVAAAMLGLAGCSGATDVRDTPAVAGASPSVAPAAAVQETCTDGQPRSASYPALKLSDRSTGLLADIVKRGRLVVGVSSDSYLLGALRAGSTTAFEGFDIDVAREMARALLGSPNRITFKVITANDRIGAVNAGVAGNGVDLVARNFTMTCDRWKQVAFSGAYFVAAQQTLVRTGTGGTSLKDFAGSGKRICAPRGSTSLAAVTRIAPGAVPYPADQHTACLALLQEGRVDAITGDNTVLAGLVAQDTATKVLPGKDSTEPYGLAAAAGHPEVARYASAVIQRMIDDGTWQSLYGKYFGARLGSARPPTLRLTKPLPS